jgi:hypothetical protein
MSFAVATCRNTLGATSAASSARTINLAAAGRLLTVEPRPSLTCGCPRATASKSCQGIGPGNTASASTISGGSALRGDRGMHTMSRLRTITRST